MTCRLASVFLAIALVPAIDAQLPVHFEEHAGQNGRRFRFMARGAGYRLFIGGNEAAIVLDEHPRPAVIRMRLRGAAPNASVHGDRLLEGKSHYFIGRDASKWRTNVPHYAKARVSDVYRGIDVVYYGNERQIEYDFIVRPGADPRQIRLHYEGVDRVDLDSAGDLVLYVAGGALRQRRPVIYQDVDSVRHRVRGAYRRLSAREFAFDVGPYDRSRPLIIDPVLGYSTYLGGSAADSGSAIAVDGTGSVYVAGVTSSMDFPIANPLQGSYNGGFDAFVAKLNASGTALVYSTYLGGSSSDDAAGLAVDASGNVYVAGSTRSADFPVANALQPASAGGSDGFIVKLSPSGSALVYSTYLGGSSYDAALGLALDSAGAAYVAGQTLSADFPTANALQSSTGGGSEGFVAKLNPAGSALVYSTYFGGSSLDIAYAIAVDGSGNGYTTGSTSSSDLPTVNPLQASNHGGQDGFVAKLNASGAALVYSTYLGGTGAEDPQGIAVDGGGNAYVVGITASTDFPTVNPLQAIHGGDLDAFLTKLNPSASAMVYSTYLGGSSSDQLGGIAVDGAGNAHVVGSTFSSNFPIVHPIQPRGLDWEALVAELDASGSALIYSTYFGGNGSDLGRGIAIGSEGRAYIVGGTSSTNLPAQNAVQPANAGSDDAFVAAVAHVADLTVAKSHGEDFRPGQSDAAYTIVVSNIGLGPSSGVVTVTDVLPAGLTATAMSGSGWTCTLATLQCTRGDALPAGASHPPITLTVTVSTTAEGTVTNTATVSGGGETNTTNDTAADAVTISAGPAIPALGPHSLAALALLLCALGFIALRR